MGLSDTDGHFKHKPISFVSSTAVSADESIESALVSESLEKDQAASTREQREDKLDMVRDDMELGENVVRANSVNGHNVELSTLEDEIVSRKEVVSDEDEIVREKEKRAHTCILKTLQPKL